jgi:uncharacterized protein
MTAALSRPAIAVCLFAKPPVAGRAKTRLVPLLGPAGAARLARAFLADSWRTVTALPWALPVLAVTEARSRYRGLRSPRGARVWRQGPGDLGARLERVFTRGLRACPAVIAVGADTPGLPAHLLEAAGRALHQGCDAVVGPAEDGGFYLLGLRRCPADLLAGLPWSVPATLRATVARLKQAGLRPRTLPRWFDVDRPADLDRLRTLLARGRVTAPVTARTLGLPSPGR